MNAGEICGRFTMILKKTPKPLYRIPFDHRNLLDFTPTSINLVDNIICSLYRLNGTISSEVEQTIKNHLEKKGREDHNTQKVIGNNNLDLASQFVRSEEERLAKEISTR